MSESNIYLSYTPTQLLEEKKKLTEQYNEYKSRNLDLNMTRGVPCKEQLDLSNDLLAVNLKDINYTAKGIGDCRNYGGLMGTSEARELFRELFDADSINEIIVSGNSSLNVMYDTIARSILFGVSEGSTPWSRLDGDKKVKFLCPVPGYDRHFSMCESFGIEMISIKINCDGKNDGPDMDEVERLVSSDPSIKGIWCTPKYSNPSGITYSDNVVKRFANLSPAAKDFRIYWDNAYIVHDLKNAGDNLLNLFAELKKNGKEDMVYMFTSTSKISFAGGGISAICASEKNIKYISSKMSFQTIGHDKINQLRHVLFFKNKAGLTAHMKKHGNIIKPKFDAVVNGFEKNLGNSGLAKWSNPNGGYFVSLFVPEGCAKKTVALATALGVALTPAGATYPYKNDPRDSNIRIAPTCPSVGDLALAIDALCVCIKLAYVEKLAK